MTKIFPSNLMTPEQVADYLGVDALRPFVNVASETDFQMLVA